MSFESLKIYTGGDVNREKIINKLLKFNYRRFSEVNQEGDFSVRGGIIDIYPTTFENPVRIELSGDKIASIRSFDLISGEVISEHKVAIILPRRVVSILTRRKKPPLELSDEVPLSNFIDLEIGDYVVHINFGIGRYCGIEKLRSNGTQHSYAVIEYMGGDKLYVPLNNMHMIQRYIGFEGRPPKLYKLGTKLWARTKQRTKKDISSVARDLLRLQAARSTLKGFNFSPDTDWQKELERSFIYKETVDQERSTQEIKRDMESPRPMDRLICGDVGYGKTEVALRAAFKAIMDNKQVAMLVPTTILAEQHYCTFSSRLKDYPVNIEMLSRFKTPKEQQLILEALAEGRVDILIGTHRLLSSDVKFKELGLVIIDEEQRFGVKDKEKLKELRLLVDVLTLTATPIPRTLYMSLMGAKDISIVNTPPPERLPIETEVHPYDKELIRKAILKEKRREGQSFFVHNQVQTIQKVYERLLRLLPEVCICIGHGQMKERDLERVMLKFIRNEVDVLLCTTIIESGIDIPNANTIIINRADRFGLAELYQLRGRVGRFNRRAYAYFLIPKDFPLTGESARRLKAIEKFCDLGSGFKIAFEDLQIRGAGNLLGTEQHGYITAVGFDLYCRLLREAIEELRIRK